MSWAALAAASAAHDPAARVPFFVGRHRAGSVAREHLPALRNWPALLAVGDEAVELQSAHRDEDLAHINQTLRDAGLVRAWRGELFNVVDLDNGEVLARTERAASRFWGTLTLGAHANGYVADALGRPTHLWVARRAFEKATDPSLFDNLVGGGVPSHQTPHEALLREGWEEAGLSLAQMQSATPGSRLRLQRAIPEGWQLEDLHVYDLPLPAGLKPQNQDGEVESFRLLPVDEALALAAGTTMTVDAALVVLDFALRHRLLPAAEAAALAPKLFACAVGRAQTP